MNFFCGHWQSFCFSRKRDSMQLTSFVSEVISKNRRFYEIDKDASKKSILPKLQFLKLTFNYMKASRMDHSQSRSQRKTKEDKENQPINSCRTQPLPIPGTRKIGLEIRSRIHKTNGKVLAEIPFPENQVSKELPKLRKSESLNIDCSEKRVKSVSFDETERGVSPSTNRQTCKKSILKKSMSSSKQLNNLKRSQISLATSHINNQDQSIEFNVGNKVITDKYETLKRELKSLKRKYRDEIYPPVKNSIYLSNSLMKNFCEMFQKEGRSIEWMRLSELYKHKKMVIWTSDKSQKSIISKGYISRSGGDGDFLANVFNVISDKNSIFQKIFESQTVNQQCIYYAKIHQTQTNIWKYVVIDDYIPVIVNKKLGQRERYSPENVFPAFLGLHPQGNTVELWPFLLQKAFAKYYSTYDSLANGNSYDFLEEITGTFMERLKIQQNSSLLQNLIKNPDVMLLLQSKKGMYFPLKNSQNSNIFTILDRQADYKQKQLSLLQLSEKCQYLHYSHLHKYYYTSRCQIQQENVKAKVKKSKDGLILREFTLEDSCQCQIASIQKEQRFYRTYLTYDYAWMRVILVQKESDGYRWISGAYTNSKTNTITASLQAGEYVVIMMPEWNDKAFDFNLIFKGTTETFFERKAYELYPNIVEESCMDIAQRWGKMVQVNKNICSYHYIERNLGLIIENVNNEKQAGSVKILRSIQGLQNYNIKAFNQQFKNKTTAEIIIKQRGHYTVILMTSRGAERSCLDMFDFGF